MFSVFLFSFNRETSIFANIFVAPDEKNVSRWLLHFDQGALGMGWASRDYYLNTTRHGKQLAAYKKYQIETLKLLVEGFATRFNCKKTCLNIQILTQNVATKSWKSR